MLEEIKKLKEEAHKHLCEAGSAGGEMFRLLERRMEATLDKAVRIASEHHLRKVEEAYKSWPVGVVMPPGGKMYISASRQAHADLTGEKVKTE